MRGKTSPGPIGVNDLYPGKTDAINEILTMKVSTKTSGEFDLPGGLGISICDLFTDLTL